MTIKDSDITLLQHTTENEIVEVLKDIFLKRGGKCYKNVRSLTDIYFEQHNYTPKFAKKLRQKIMKEFNTF